MDEREFTSSLLSTAAAADVAVSYGHAKLFYEHARLMAEWNRHTNLTRISNIHDVIVKHILDSLLPARWLPSSGYSLDVGTGPGFPGIPLKILHPELQMVLLETHRKKVSFLRVLLSRLEMKGITVAHGRWEDYGIGSGSPDRGKYALITMRAVRMEKQHVSDLASRILKPEGIFAWWAGPGYKPDSEEAFGRHWDADVVFERDYTYRLPGIPTPRHLLIWKKLGKLAI